MIARRLRRAGQVCFLALATQRYSPRAGGGGESSSSSPGGPESPSDIGQLAIRLTDSHCCNYRSVWFTVEQVRIHKSAAVGDGDSGWRDLALSPARRVDLLTLRNGVFVDLGTVPLPAGNYAQVRPVPSANTGGQPPFANQLDLTDGRPVTSKSGALGKHHLTERPLTDFG